MKAIKKIIAIALTLAFTMNVIYAVPPISNDTGNVAPVTSFEALKINKKNVDIVIVTDYAGADLANLKSSVTELVNNNVMSYNIKVKYVDNTTPRINIGTQNSTYTVTTYGIPAYATYTWSGQQSDIYGNVQTYTNKTQTDTFYLNNVQLKPGENPPSGVNTPPSYYWYEDKSTNGMFGGGRDYIYRFNGYPGTFYFWINYSYVNGSGGSIVGNRTSWSGPTFTYSTSWTPYQTYQQPSSNTVPAWDLRNFSSTPTQANSDVYVLFALNKASTDYYTSSVYNVSNINNYMLGNMRTDNVAKFVQEKNAHVYSIANDAINNTKLANGDPYNISFTSGTYSQNISISDLINSYSQDGRKYGQLQYAKAIDNIAVNFAKPQSNNLDLIIATDKDTATANSYLNSIKSSLPSSININSTILNSTNPATIANNSKPTFNGTIKRFYIGYSYSQPSTVLLNDTGDLYAIGNNSAYLYKASYYGTPDYTDGLYGVPGYSIGLTKIMTNVAQFEIVGGYYYFQIIVLKKDGTVWASGSNFSGIITPITNGRYIKTFTQIQGISNVKKFIADLKIPMQDDGDGGNIPQYDFNSWKEKLIFLTNDGKVYGMGEYDSYLFDSANQYGNKTVPTLLPDISGATDLKIISNSWGSTLIAGGSDGSVKIKGINNTKYTRVYDTWKYYPSFTTLYSLSQPIKEIFDFGYYRDSVGIVLDNNDLYVDSQNQNYNGDLGTGQSVTITKPTKILSNFKKYYAGGYGVSYFVTTDNKLYYSGQASNIQEGVKGTLQTTTNYYIPTLSATVTNVDFLYSRGNWNSQLYIKKTDGFWYLMGSFQPDQLFDTTTRYWYSSTDARNTYKTITYIFPEKLIPSSDLQVTSFVVTNDYFYGLDMQGRLFTMQYNTSGSNPITYTYSKYSNVNIYGACSLENIPVNAIDKTAIMNKSLAADSERYFIYISDNYSLDTMKPYGSYYPFGNLTTDFINYLKSNNFYTYVVSANEALDFKLQPPYIPTAIQNATLRQLASGDWRDGYTYLSLNKVINLMATRYATFEALYTPASYVVVSEDVVEYRKAYADYENDSVYQELYMYEHDPSVFENDTGTISNAGQWISTPITTFTKKGKYIIHYKAKDSVSASDLFDNYRKWSNESTYTVYVHERPIVLTNISITPNGPYFNIKATDGSSYDNDHTSRADKGIVAHEWRWKEFTEATWHNEQINITNAVMSKVYLVEHRVQDLEGAWSNWATSTIDNTKPPIALFTIDKNPITTQETLKLKDKSIAYLGTITNWQWIVKKLDTNAIVQNAQFTNSNNGTGVMSGYDVNVKTNFSDVGTGTYRIYLRVKGSNGLWSDGGTDALTGYNLANSYYQDLVVNEAFKLEIFRVMKVRDLQLESYYYNTATGNYDDKPMDVNQMAIDAVSFAGMTDGLTKGYKFEFAIDSKNFNAAADTIVITPRFYTTDSFTRDAAERDLYWEDSYHEIYKAGTGAHAGYNTITLDSNDRTITSATDASWRGEYFIPGTAWAVPMGTSAANAKANKIDRDIIINFTIRGYKSGVLQFDYNASQWSKDRTASKYPYLIGDVIRYSWNKNSLDDINAKDNR